MSARNDTYKLMNDLSRRAVELGFDEANTLRRAELTLQRWAELECGDGNDYASWSIERDEVTGIPYKCIYPHSGSTRRYRVADKETGALRRVRAICERHGLSYFHQTDPRGCALYVSPEPLTDSNYSSRGVACCA